MASVVNPGEILKPSSAKTNYLRLSRLLINAGTKILREVFNAIIPSSNLARKLTSSPVKKGLKRLKKRKILTNAEWQVIFPSPGTCVNSKSFDITLLIKLLREFNVLAPPLKGWDDLPDDKDVSLSADLARIKYYRNKLSHTNDNMDVYESEFKDQSNRIKNALLRMLNYAVGFKPKLIEEWEIAIDNLLTGPIADEDEAKKKEGIEQTGKQFELFLKDYYSKGDRVLIPPFPWMEGDRFHINNLYTSVNIVEKDTDNTVEMKSLFSPNAWSLKNCRRLLIEGEPGIGKSSFCKKTAYDWSIDKNPKSFPKFDLALVLKCGSFHHDDIWSAIEEQILPKELCDKKDEVFYYIRQNQDKILLIIDGFDEIPEISGAKMKKTIQEIMSGKLLSQCHLIVTCRTDKEPELQKHFDKKMEIKGFQWSDSCDFIRRFFSSSFEAEAVISSILKSIDHRELVCNPMYAAFTCLIFEDQHVLDLYSFPKEIIFSVAERYCVEKREQQVNDDTLVDGFLDGHLMLGKLAFNLIKENVSYFDEQQFSSYSAAHFLKDFGFLSQKTIINKIRPKSWYYFSHSSMKKFFAALYVRKMPGPEVT